MFLLVWLILWVVGESAALLMLGSTLHRLLATITVRLAGDTLEVRKRFLFWHSERSVPRERIARVIHAPTKADADEYGLWLAANGREDIVRAGLRDKLYWLGALIADWAQVPLISRPRQDGKQQAS
jgi:hypothetical protein